MWQNKSEINLTIICSIKIAQCHNTYVGSGIVLPEGRKTAVKWCVRSDVVFRSVNNSLSCGQISNVDLYAVLAQSTGGVHRLCIYLLVAKSHFRRPVFGYISDFNYPHKWTCPDWLSRNDFLMRLKFSENVFITT